MAVAILGEFRRTVAAPIACVSMGVYADLGVRPLINAWGTVTVVGGSLMDPRVLDAMREASTAFVDLPALQRHAGERIAKLLGVDAACVTSGAAAGLTLAAAACMTRGNPDRRAQLPDTTGLRDECLMLRVHRNRYDRAVSLSGIRVRDVAGDTDLTIDDVRAAVTDRTAMFLYMAEAETIPGSLPLRKIARVMHEHGIPVIVDAAAELPPVSGIGRRLSDGADLLVLSGGKEIGGPQSSGMILGDTELVGECAAHAYPHHGIGRGMKTDKETIVGLVTAVGLFVQRDEPARVIEWERMVAEMVAALGARDDLRVRRHVLTEPGIQPAAIPRAYVLPLRASATEVADRMLAGDPAVVVGIDGAEIALNPQCLTPKQVPLVVRAVAEACASAR